MSAYHRTSVLAVCALALSVLTSHAVLAQQAQHGHGGHQGREQGPAPHASQYDGRYSHNRYYTTPGVEVATVPGRPYVVAHGGAHYYYSGGIWYAPRGPNYVVIGPPVGVYVPVLPPFYTTVWFAGVPYYYANNTYYTYAGPQGYEVVDAPADGSAVQGPQGPAYPGAPPPAPGGSHPEGEDIFVYPQQGQSPDQQANDRYDCHKWASSQTGFDPTQAGGGVAPDQTVARGEDYKRAMRACLEGRGYSVR
jgi:hypothetical protein